MKLLLKIFIILFTPAIISCSARNNSTAGDYVIRYINMNTVYEYVYNNSNEAQEIKRKADFINKKINELENSGKDSRSDIAYYKNELIKLKEQEKRLKTEIYSRIRSAVNNIAAKHNADFILNSGDGVIYSRPVYDVTNEVIRELKSLDARSSPVFK